MKTIAALFIFLSFETSLATETHPAVLGCYEYFEKDDFEDGSEINKFIEKNIIAKLSQSSTTKALAKTVENKLIIVGEELKPEFCDKLAADIRKLEQEKTKSKR